MGSRLVRFSSAAASLALGPSLAAGLPSSNAVMTDAAIRDWLATHPEAVDKIVHDSLLRQPNILAEIGAAAARSNAGFMHE